MNRLLSALLLTLIAVNAFSQSIEKQIESERYVRSTDSLIDSFTQQQWQDNDDSKRTWGQANQYCQNLTLEGKSDWRLPEISAIDRMPRYKLFKQYLYNFAWSNQKNIAYHNEMYPGQSKTLDATIFNSEGLWLRCIRGPKYNSKEDIYASLKKRRELLIAERYKILYEQAKKNNSIISYENYIGIYPNSPYIKDSKESIRRIIEEKFQQSLRLGTVESYRVFIDAHPSSNQSKEAYKNICIIEFDRVATVNNIVGYQWFVDTYKESSLAKDALKRIYSLSFNEAKNIDTLESYNDFIIAYPYASEVAEATQRAYKLESKKYSEWFASDEKNSRALLIQSKRLSRKMRNEKVKDGYLLVLNRMSELLQDKFPGEEATLRYLESEEYMDFVDKLNIALEAIKGSLDSIANNTSSINRLIEKQSSLMGSYFISSAQEQKMANFYTKQHQEWENTMHLLDKGYN